MCCICAGQYELNSVTFIASFIKKSCFSCIPSNDRMYCTPLLYISAIQWTFLRLFHAFRPFPSLKALSELFGNDSAKFKCLNPAVTAKKLFFFLRCCCSSHSFESFFSFDIENRIVLFRLNEAPLVCTFAFLFMPIFEWNLKIQWPYLHFTEAPKFAVSFFQSFFCYSVDIWRYSLVALSFF